MRKAFLAATIGLVWAAMYYCEGVVLSAISEFFGVAIAPIEAAFWAACAHAAWRTLLRLEIQQ